MDQESYEAVLNAVIAIKDGQMEGDSRGEMALAVMAEIDPTGISAAVAAYKKPLCPL